MNKKAIKEVLSIALPAVGEMFLYVMIWFFDTAMVGKYGGQVAVSTVGLCSEMMAGIINIFIILGICVGSISLISRSLGGNNFDLAEEYTSISFFIGIILSLLISTMAYTFAPRLLHFAGSKDQVLSLGIVYLRITSIGLFFNMLMNVLNSALRGTKNTKTPLFASAIVNVVNIFLDWAMIFGKAGFPELGVKGAAIATSIAHFTGFLFIVIYTFKYSPLKPRLIHIKNMSLLKLKNLIKLSIPSSLQEAAYSIARIWGIFVMMGLGEASFAANQIATTVESISYMPGTGFGVACTALVGHKIGEGNFKEANEYAKTCAFLSLIFMSLCSAAFLIFPKFIVLLFINKSEVEVIKLGMLCIMVAAAEQPFMALYLVFGGALKGAGDTKTPFYISLIAAWAIRVPFMLYFIGHLKASVHYNWWITAGQWAFQGIAIYLVFKKRFSHPQKLQDNYLVNG
ncbi:MATE family efflux transporter [Clostridium tetani]|uniref:MATE family efflux transporter n=1 Tax=Clostridium tetani TaxID=1513 RepID=UPI00100AA41D|nr:MATE family efflux transporter [Clostridium tetani]RXI40005.1 MATE family efflux transporter [Clostridium tetani]